MSIVDWAKAKGKRSPVRISVPGATTMIRFDERGVAVGVTRDLLEKMSRDSYQYYEESLEASVRAAKRLGYIEGHAAALSAPVMKDGAL